jgi:hypothetical protein
VDGYYEGFNEKLFKALPDASRILEIGCASGRLGGRYKSEHPTASWVGIDFDPAVVSAAAQRLDRVYVRDLAREELDDVGDGYDCVVLGDVLEHIARPEDLLLQLESVTTADAQMMLCVPNGAHVSIVERLLLGDLTYEDAGLMDRTHVRMFSSSSLLKLLLDCGWWPEVVDRYVVGHADPGLVEQLGVIARRLGASPHFADLTLTSYQLIVSCRKLPGRPEREKPGTFSVVVPVNNEPVFALNVMASPGLRECGAEIVPCRRQPTAAAAFRSGASLARHDWIVFCHQDVYFPRGTGVALAKILGDVPSSERRQTLIGFAGIGLDRDAREYEAGMVLDRFRRLDWPAAEAATSLDEFAVVLARDSNLAIDGELGWHLWATELCLQAIRRGFPPARILRLPLFHNSLTGFSLPAAFHASAKILAAKYADQAPIRSLCGVIQQNPS